MAVRASGRADGNGWQTGGATYASSGKGDFGFADYTAGMAVPCKASEATEIKGN